MKVLLSAFSCGPNMGSEEGVGWNWALEVARLGHDVVALTDIDHRDEIEAEVARGAVPANLRFEFFMPAWLDRLRNLGYRRFDPSLTAHLTHLAWQVLAYRYVRTRFAGVRFDLVHHITYSGIRHPTFMGRLPYPLALGPLGGGERAPMALRRGYPWKGWLRDLARDLHTYSLRFDPITLRACAEAMVVYVKTEQSRAALPERFRHKIAVHMEVGIREQAPPERAPRPQGAPLKLLYVGRFLYWKGMHLGLRGFAEFLARGGSGRLTMLGRGPDERAWRALSRELDIEHAVDWLAWVEHSEVGALYRAHDALLFPSLHDSSGNAVLEALAHGLPVICLDLGGPAEMVNASCGRVVSTRERGLQACVRRIADAIEELARSPELCRQLSDGAWARAQEFLWSAQVASLYDDIGRRMRSEAALRTAVTASEAEPSRL